MSDAHTRLLTSAVGSRPPPCSEAPARQALAGRVLPVTAGHSLYSWGERGIPCGRGVQETCQGGLAGGGRAGLSFRARAVRPRMRSRDLGSSSRNIPRLLTAFVSLSANWGAGGLGGAPPGTKAGRARACSHRPERGLRTLRKGPRGGRATWDSAGQHRVRWGLRISLVHSRCGSCVSGPQVCDCVSISETQTLPVMSMAV